MQFSLFIFILCLIRAESLKCFQCESQTYDERPVCNFEYWGQLNSSARKSLMTHCPPSRAAFCIIQVEMLGGSNERVTRGCTVDHTQDGIGLVVGCFVSRFKKACLCDGDLCNVSATLRPNPIFIAISLTTLFINMLK